MTYRKYLPILLIPMFLQACAHNKASGEYPDSTITKTETSDKVSASGSHMDENIDKFERFNRFSFALNNQLDRFILRPLSVGYRAITTKYVRERISFALTNLKEPVSSINNMIQGEFASGMKNIGRFAINSTLGLAGMYDVAGGGFSLDPKPNSFDKTLANWCINDGPYLVLPILGPSTPRSLVGDSVDGLGNPVFLATYNDANVRAKILYPYYALSAVSAREANMELIDDFRNNSVDFYATVRSAYLQNRKKIPVCGVIANDENQSLGYDFDMDMDDEY